MLDVDATACRSPVRSACRGRRAPPRSTARCRTRSRHTPAPPPSARRRMHSPRSPRSRRTRPSAEIFTRETLMPRYSQRCSFSRIATRTRPASLRTNSQAPAVTTTRKRAGDPEPGVRCRYVEALEARQPAARAGEVAARIQDLRHDDRQHQRDHRTRRAARRRDRSASQPTSSATITRDDDAGDEGQRRIAGTEAQRA